MRKIEVQRITRALEAIPTEDPEQAHGLADDLLLEAVPTEVAEAYRALVKRCAWWATA